MALSATGLGIRDHTQHSSLCPTRSDFFVVGVRMLGLEVALGLDKLVFELVKLRRSEALVAEDLRLDPIWSDSSNLVVHVPRCWHTEDIVKFYLVG